MYSAITNRRTVLIGRFSNVPKLPFEYEISDCGMGGVVRAANKLKKSEILIFGPTADLYTPATVNDLRDPFAFRPNGTSDGSLQLMSRHRTPEPIDLEAIGLLSVDLWPFRLEGRTPTRFRGWHRPGNQPPPSRSQLEVCKYEEQVANIEARESSAASPIWLMKPIVEPDCIVNTNELEVIEAYLNDPFRPAPGESNMYDAEKSCRPGRTLIFLTPALKPTVRNFVNTRFRRLFHLGNQVPHEELPDTARLLRDIAPIRDIDMRPWINWCSDGYARPGIEDPTANYGYLEGAQYVVATSPDGRLLAVAFKDQWNNRIVILPFNRHRRHTFSMLSSVVANTKLERMPNVRASLIKTHRLYTKAKMLPPTSAAWSLCQEQIQAASTAPNSHVLLVGDTGSGKEFLATLLHGLTTTRQAKKMSEMNCATLTQALVTSQLFGHVEGVASFIKTHDGIFKKADGSTVFLDEFQEILKAEDTSAKLLRFLEEGTFCRVGEEDKVQHADVRVVAATNDARFLDDDHPAVKSGLLGRFTFVIRVPDLLQRWSDVCPLVEFMLDHHLKFGDARGLTGTSPDTRPYLQVDHGTRTKLIEVIMARMDVGKLEAMNIRWVRRVVRETVTTLHREMSEFPSRRKRGRAAIWNSPEELLQALEILQKGQANTTDSKVPAGTYCGFKSKAGFDTYISEINPRTTSAKRPKASLDAFNRIKILLKSDDVVKALEQIKRLRPEAT